MRENVYFQFMHTLVLFILSLVFLWFNTTSATSVDHQLVVASEGAVHTCIDKERKALLDFKAHLQDPYNWLSTWRPQEEDDCCQWVGDQTGHVTTLDLSDVRLELGSFEGEISLSLLNLTHLNYLDLSYCNLYGTIPVAIGKMTHLTHLNLFNNHLTGTTPESIGNMTRLTYLDLSNNHLTGIIPESIGNMIQLTYLDLSENSFHGSDGTIRMLIGSMTQLNHLDLGNNHLTGTIPESIVNMTRLTFLNLDENNLCGAIPRSVGSLTKLTNLYLSKNSLHQAIPPELGNLTNLVGLSLSVENLDWLSSLSELNDLNLDGSSLDKASHLVDVIIGLQNLLYLSLRGCDLSQVMHLYSSSANSSSSVADLSIDNSNLNSSMFPWLCPLMGNNLENLDISGNKFDGKLSDFLSNLSACASSVATLDILHASSNQFTGSLSDEIQNFPNLSDLNLASNQLDGTISDKLWQLDNLQYLDLSFNSHLRGSISQVLPNVFELKLSNNLMEGFPFTGNWEELAYIDLRSNKLGPRFPEGIQTLNSSIGHLDLSNNNISDTFPTNSQNKFSLPISGYFNLSFNNMSGKLPDFQSNVGLKIVDLSSNNFHGRVPVFSAELRYLDLSRNKLNGGISFLCHLKESLEFLDLSYNSLTGQLPDCLQKLTKLRVLNLGNNFLSGRLPPSIGYLSQLETLCLYNNSFSGIHSYLKNLTKLSLLDLGANKFSGIVPVWIGENLPRLYVISLGSNNFFGNIPSQICHLITLQILDLSKNNLHGTIPPCVDNLTAMVQKGLFVKQTVHNFHLELPVDLTDNKIVDTSYFDHLMIQWQGKASEFSSILGLVKTIDLSSNNLTGKIPYELTNLHGLLVLDLSHNALIGKIPQNIGQMTELLTLNLSRNFFSGEIPSTISQIARLNHLDVSYNKLSGRVPTSTQLQSFPPEWFVGNVGLCGPPAKKCLEDEDLGAPPVGHSDGDAESTDELQRWFYIGGATGFATAFWIACSALIFNRRLRHAFFRFHDCLKDWVYVKVLVFVARLQRAGRA